MTRHLALVHDLLAAPLARRSGAAAPNERRLRFGDFELVSRSGELFRRNGSSRVRPVKLQPQPARVLLYLAERSGRLVSRAELQRHLWGENHYVDYDQGLNYCIRAVRRALGDDAGDPRFLETVPRRGYRFIGRVEIEDAGGDGEPGGRPSSRLGDVWRATGHPRLGLVLAAMALLGFALHWALAAGAPGPSPRPKTPA